MKFGFGRLVSLWAGTSFLVASLGLGSPVDANPGCGGPANFTPSGVIGQKWQSFNGPASSLGCPVEPEIDYQTTVASNPQHGRMQAFQHGVIVWYPNLGPSMTLSTWYNGPNVIHFDFSDVTPYPEAYRVIVKPLNGLGQIYDLPGGSAGHNRDVGSGAAASSGEGMAVVLETCSSSPSGPVCATSGGQVVASQMSQRMSGGSYANNLSHEVTVVAPPALPPANPPAGGVASRIFTLPAATVGDCTLNSGSLTINSAGVAAWQGLVTIHAGLFDLDDMHVQPTLLDSSGRTLFTGPDMITASVDLGNSGTTVPFNAFSDAGPVYNQPLKFNFPASLYAQATKLTTHDSC